MGSLMGGWDSPVSDPKSVKFQRNRSSTKEEIATYWRSEKKKQEKNKNTWEGSKKRHKRSNSLPLDTIAKENPMMDLHEEEGVENLLKKNDWWISSNWAFLNEPPEISSDGPTHKYTSQLHVAHINNSNSHSTAKGIGT